MLVQATKCGSIVKKRSRLVEHRPSKQCTTHAHTYSFAGPHSCINLNVFAFKHTHTRANTHIHKREHTHTHTHTRANTHIHTHTHTRAHTRVRIHTCTHIDTHTKLPAVPFRMLDEDGGLQAAALNAYRLLSTSAHLTQAAAGRVLGFSTSAIGELR
jgi:hypothetical protein